MSSPALPYAGDQEQRREALDPSRSFAVQAPAGSGKTELLIQRFLRLLGSVERPESIVAITFTRKAAGEMLERVLGALRGAASGAAVEKPHEQITRELASAALARDRELAWGLLDQPGRLRIQTIDSLCASIAGAMPWLARLGAMPRIEDDVRPLYEEAARRTVLTVGDPEHGAPVAALLAHLDNSAGRLSGLLAAMLPAREQWLAMTAPPGDEERALIERAMRRAIVRGIEAADRMIAPELHEAWLGFARDAGSHWMEHWPAADQREAWQSLVDAVFTRGDDWRRQPAPGGGGGQKQAFTAMIARLSAIDGLEDALTFVRRLPPARYTDAQWRAMQALLATLRIAAARLNETFREEGVIDFAEIGIAARRALGALDQPTDVAFRMDARIEHLLVDEFQDTSRGQLELLEKLTWGWQAGDGRTLFLVGDPMQSIYRFRQAEMGLFLEAKQRGIGGLRLHPITLGANHRTIAPLLEHINTVFARIFPSAEDIETGAIAFAGSHAGKPDDSELQAAPCWSFHPFPEGAEAWEAQRVVDLARGAHRRDPEGTVAILVRARPHLGEIVKALKAADLRFQAVDIDPLSEKPAVRDLLALTRAMLHLGDRISWLAIVRAPWCGLTLSDLEALVKDHSADLPDASNGNPQAGNPQYELFASAAAARDRWTVWECLHELSPLGEDGRVRAERLRSILGEALSERGRWPLRRWVERAWVALGGPAWLERDESAFQDARDYFDLLEAEQRGADLADFDHFRDRVQELYAKPDPQAGPSLQVMTIHKAKGLEFDTVIVPGLGRVDRVEESRLFLFHEWEEMEAGGTRVERLLAPIKEAGAESDPLYGYLRSLENRKDRYERVRQLYVAATRAKKRLHLLGHVKVKQSGEPYPDGRSMLADLWPALGDEERRALPKMADAAGTADPAAGVPLRRLPIGWSAPELPSEATWEGGDQEIPQAPHEPSFEWVGETLRHAGTVVHAILRQSAGGQVQIPSFASLRRALLRQGVVPAELDRAAARVRAALEKAAISERVRWILASHREARSEHAVTGVVEGAIVRGAIDRTFIDQDGVRWIVDFKTSAHEGGALEEFLDEQQRRYREQMERYARLLESTGNPVRLGLYFPLMDGWREWGWRE